MATVRPPAVAGTFYPADPRVLSATVRELLARAPPSGPSPLALIAPHAGYVYSGEIAARAYALLAPRAGDIRRVVLLSPAHRVPLLGLGASGADFFETPLGSVPLDGEALDLALGHPSVGIHDAAHRDEHGVEVHLPFLQMILESFTLLPLVVGDAADREVSEVLERVWTDPDTLVVVSSDLSHYLPYPEAAAKDARTARAIEELRPGDLDAASACGRIPIRGLLLQVRGRGLRVRTLDLRNSGDTAGSRDQVVGYGAFVVHA